MDDTCTINVPFFANLTQKQRHTLELLAEGRTSKEIAYALGISESAAVQRIERLRAKSGGNSRAELARTFRAAQGGAPACKQFTGQKIHLHDEAVNLDSYVRNDDGSCLSFSDSITFDGGEAWANQLDLHVVPGVLDGKNALFFRWLCVVGIALATVVTVLILVASAQSLGEIF